MHDDNVNKCSLNKKSRIMALYDDTNVRNETILKES